MQRKMVKRSGRPRGLSRRQRAFTREKVLGLNDKEAALAAGYSLSVAENTSQKIWSKPQVRAEFARLKTRFAGGS
jgi:phage terminase small subunit